jgi:co-chaperonin GroES (HSP10)|tara:strand:- start:915 stop:1331 length:417 start_codon:yes stop_codon:yes gene_type:complete
MTFRAIIWMMIMTSISEKVPEVTEEELDAQLPKPVGYRLLVALPEVEDTYGESGIIKSSKEMHNDHIMSIMGLVLDMGDGAYSDKERFPTGPWCKTGDYVMFRMNTGTRFKVGGVEYRLMNDDSIEATVTDPRGISRA